MAKSKPEPELQPEKEPVDTSTIRTIMEFANETIFFSAKPSSAIEWFLESYETQLKVSRKDAEKIAARYMKADKDGYLSFVE